MMPQTAYFFVCEAKRAQCKIDLYRRFFVKSIDIIRNECYSTNRTKSVEEDTAMAVSSINMMRSE